MGFNLHSLMKQWASNKASPDRVPLFARVVCDGSRLSRRPEETGYTVVFAHQNCARLFTVSGSGFCSAKVVLCGLESTYQHPFRVAWPLDLLWNS